MPRHWFGGLRGPHPDRLRGEPAVPPRRAFLRALGLPLPRSHRGPGAARRHQGLRPPGGRHARAHEDYFDTSARPRLEIDRFLKAYAWVTSRLEKLQSPELRLAATAAAEHFTAIMAEGAATEMPYDLVPRRCASCSLWHAAEELEHKSVAFDVLQAVDPSYARRVAGLAVATVMLSTWWAVARAHAAAPGRHRPRRGGAPAARDAPGRGRRRGPHAAARLPARVRARHPRVPAPRLPPRPQRQLPPRRRGLARAEAARAEVARAATPGPPA
ncbi:MAG: metal-dependent hydrolase [Kofleriaceae bacterium]|nr:metal-dependent hydrolase [Kofleriaceae bacterium]